MHVEGGKCLLKDLCLGVCPLGFGVLWSVNTPRKEQQQQQKTLTAHSHVHSRRKLEHCPRMEF
ncbi:hypothetical protein Nmel_005094, partial [Mimus melanotis]